MATSRLSTRRVEWRVQVGTSNKPGQGLVIFEASVSYIPDPLAAGGPRTAIPEPVAAVLDSSGYACTPAPGDPSAPGERGVALFTTDSLGEDGGDWTWTARPQLRSVNGIQMANAVPAFSFAVPTGAGSLDLAEVQKVPASPGLGTERAVALVMRAEKAVQDALNVVTGTVGVIAAEAVSTEIEIRDLIEGSDSRIPEHQSVPGLSITMTDERGARTRLEANDVDGGPTPHSLSLDGPALKEHMDFLTGDDTRVPLVDEVPGVSLAMVDKLGRPLWLQANDSNGGPTPFATGLLREALGVNSSEVTYIADGDSITQGGHGGGTPHNWPAHLSTLIGKPVINRGRSGSTAVEAAMRQGGVTPILTVPGGVLPGEPAVSVPVDKVFPTAEAGGYTGGVGHGPRTYTGTFDGIPAELTENTDDTWTLRRTVAGPVYKTVDRTPFIIDGLDPSATRIFWPGRNDYPKTNVLANIDAMAKWTTGNGGRFLILSILTKSGSPETDADNVEVRAINEALQLKYPRNYVNIRAWLVKYGVAAAGLTPTQADLEATATGGIPPSLMADSLHPNAPGRVAIAKYIHQQLVARNWV